MLNGLTLFTILACFTMAGMVYFRKPQDIAYQSMAMLNFCLAVWAIANWLAIRPETSPFARANTPTFQFFFVQVVMFMTAPIPWLFLRFVLYFVPLEYHWMKRLRQTLPYLFIWITIVMFTAFTPLMFSSYEFDTTWKALTPGPAAIAYGLTFATMSSAGVAILLAAYRAQQGLIKLQILYVLFGLALTTIFGFTTNFILVIFQRFEFLELGPYSALFLLSCVSYAIIRHRLLDLKIVVIRLFSSFLTVMIVTSLALGIWMSSLHVIERYWFGSSQSWHVFLTVGCTAIVFPILFSFIQSWTQRLFLTTVFSPENAYKDLSQITAEVHETQELLALLGQHISTHVNVQVCQFIFQHKHTAILYENLEKEWHHNGSQKMIVFDELTETSLKNLLLQNDIMVLLPLQLNTKLIGWMTLSAKHSGNAFSAPELTFCQNILPQITLALFHAQSRRKAAQAERQLQREVNKATTELRQANAQLSQLDRLKDEFVSIASHELRTPMTAIRSYLWLCLFGSQEQLSPRIKNHLDIAYSATERLLLLVKDLLTISELEGGQLKLKKQSLHIGEVVTNVIQELLVEAKKKQISIVMKNELHSTNQFHADSMKLTEILHNLLGNAIKFSPAQKNIVIKLNYRKQMFKISIRDHGPGMSKEQQQRLFTKFGVGRDVSQSQPHQGTGLGLYIAQQFAKLHDGDIHVRSKLGKGTLFTLYLPEVER